MLKVKAQGGGYDGVYTARKDPARGWYFVEKWGTYLTPGFGRPMFYPTEGELLEAVRAHPAGVRVTPIVGG